MVGRGRSSCIEYTLFLPEMKYFNLVHTSAIWKASSDVSYKLRDIIAIREHPFNLKDRGWGSMVFFGVKFVFFCFAAQQNFFSRHYFFSSTKTIFFKSQSANRIFFLPISETEFFPKKNPIAPPPLQVKWMFPKLENMVYYYRYTVLSKVYDTCSLTWRIWYITTNIM